MITLNTIHFDRDGQKMELNEPRQQHDETAVGCVFKIGQLDLKR